MYPSAQHNEQLQHQELSKALELKIKVDICFHTNN
jgi:hypothetical protein